ncbi:MAG: hypothetical protein AAFT19_10570 [Pseudomonadota bacterium]
MRSELAPGEKAAATEERKRLWQARGRPRCPTTHAGHQRGFAADTVAKTDRSKNDINCHVRHGESIAPEVMADIKADPDLNKGVVPDMVARASTPDHTSPTRGQRSTQKTF